MTTALRYCPHCHKHIGEPIHGAKVLSEEMVKRCWTELRLYQAHLKMTSEIDALNELANDATHLAGLLSMILRGEDFPPSPGDTDAAATPPASVHGGTGAATCERSEA
jgi:hypothetical protein